MTTSEFKKTGRILKEVYAQLEAEAIADGVDIFSAEFSEIRDRVRLAVLTKMGFTLEEYREAKELVAPAKRVNVEEQIERTKEEVAQTQQSVSDLVIPNEEEILAKAKAIAEAVVKAPVIQNNIVERTTIEKPTIVKETVVQTINEEYNDGPLMAEIGYLNDKLDNLEIPEPFDPKELLDQMRSEFGEHFKENINTLGMPDFRKLAMGLQAQIDTLSNQPATGDIILQSPNGTNWQIGITNAGELTATEV